MQVWATASARAPIVVGVFVARSASSTTPSHRRTGLGPGSLRAAGAGPTAARTVIASEMATVRPTDPDLVGHEDMAEDQLAAEAALAGGHGGRGAHGVVLVPERGGEVDVEAVAAGVDGLLEPAVPDGGGGDGQEVVLGVLHDGTADRGERAHLAGGPDLACLLVDVGG